MELKAYFLIARRWAWLLVLGLVLGGVGGYAFSSSQTPIYEASTRAMVMRPPKEGISDYNYLSDQQLTQTYLQLLTTQPVLDAASAELGYDVRDEQVTAQQIRDTQVIQVTVEDPYPERAADIANVLVKQMILQNESLQTGRFSSAEASLQEQVQQMEAQISGLQTVIAQISTQNLKDQKAQLEAQIAPLQEEVSTLEQEIVALPSWSTEAKVQIAEKQARIDQIRPLLGLYQEIYSNLVVFGEPFENAGSQDLRLEQLQNQLGLYQQIYINLLNSLESIRLARLQNTPNVVQIEPAAVPMEPIRPRPLTNTALATAVGLMLAAGIVFLIEYLDDTLKTPEQVERMLGLPVLGFVAEMQYKGKSAEEVYVSRQPRSPVSEAFRALRTNLEFSSFQKPIRTILVTSAGPSEGKTTVAVNLAAILSQGEKRVALVDADLRRPHVHRFLGLPNRAGLSDLFRTQTKAYTLAHGKEDLPHLMVLTSGNLPPNPAELLGSNRMDHILEDLKGLVDVIVIDTPPSLVADAQVLAAKVDAVLFVVQPGYTQAEAARASMEMFKRAEARMVGVVMNRIPRNRNHYYGGYKYYSPYNNSKGYYSQQGAQPAEITKEETEVIRDGWQAFESDSGVPSPFSGSLPDDPETFPRPDPSKI